MYDVAIIGGGPAGSTCGSLLKKYDPSLSVIILERENFPRDHVGESLLPAVTRVLDEMGCWDKVEAADFPIKIGATYKWGNTPGFWDFEFVPTMQFKNEPRPGKFEGQRSLTAFQVDRSIYDEILLKHAEEMGCEVRQGTKVREILRDGDKVEGYVLDSGETITARYYIDASGNSALMRKAMGVEADYPTLLRNIAIWDYWDNADWAVKIGTGGTRILVCSVGYGWIWFIPIGPTRTSIGLVIPLSYYKESGKKPDELYLKALQDDEKIVSLMKNATRQNRFFTTNDWSYVAERLTGENWFLIGDTCGFADPILSAGMTLAMMGARHVAYNILEIERGNHDVKWLKQFYNDNQRARIRQHIMFADFWYSSNGQFTDLVEYTREIARQAGHELTADAAFRWLGTGGFAHDDPSLPIVGGLAVQAVKRVGEQLSHTKASWAVSENNIFTLNLEGATEDVLPVLFEGKIYPKPCYVRGKKILPRYGVFEIVIQTLLKEKIGLLAVERLRAYFRQNRIYPHPETGVEMCLATIEAMIADGWINAERDPNEGFVDFRIPDESAVIHSNRDMLLV